MNFFEFITPRVKYTEEEASKKSIKLGRSQLQQFTVPWKKPLPAMEYFYKQNIQQFLSTLGLQAASSLLLPDFKVTDQLFAGRTFPQ